MGEKFEKIGGTYVMILSSIISLYFIYFFISLVTSKTLSPEAQAVKGTYIFYYVIGFLIFAFSVFSGFKIIMGHNWAKIYSFFPIILSFFVIQNFLSFLGMFTLLIPLLGIVFVSLSFKKDKIEEVSSS